MKNIIEKLVPFSPDQTTVGTQILESLKVSKIRKEIAYDNVI